jgi:hypothetical protein
MELSVYMKFQQSGVVLHRFVAKLPMSCECTAKQMSLNRAEIVPHGSCDKCQNAARDLCKSMHAPMGLEKGSGYDIVVRGPPYWYQPTPFKAGYFSYL